MACVDVKETREWEGGEREEKVERRVFGKYNRIEE